MPQTFHKFRAETFDQAYSAMRRKLGNEAIVIRTATVTEGGILGGLFGRTMVELTASSNESAGGRRKLSPVEKRYLTAGRLPGERAAERSSEPPVGSDERVQETVAYFKRLIQDAQERAGIQPVGEPKPKPESPATAAQTPAKPMSETPTRQEAKRHQHEADELRRDVAEMRELLNVLAAEMPISDLPPQILPHYRVLLSRGVERKRAAALIRAATTRMDDRSMRDPRVFLERMKVEVRKEIRVNGGIGLKSGERHVVAFVGPTGVGKTTNLAKLAAQYSIQHRSRVGVVTADTYRVAATDQLNVYTNIIDVDMKIAHDADEMRAVIKSFEDRDLVLIDTAGGSPYNEEQMEETRKMLAAASLNEVHLLLSAATGVEDLRAIITQFSRLQPSAVLFTKLDETKRYGPLYSIGAEAGLPLSYFSIGQNVPDDIMLADAGMVANLVVEGGDRRGGSSTKSA